jgi:hypothetical protein
MPLPTNYSRPSLPYQPLQSLPNDQRFVILTTLQQPPTAEMFDAELNAVMDKINILAGAINGVVAGNIPGSDNPDNAGKFLVTDGAGNLSFIFVGSDNISAGAISTLLLQDQAVIRAKIGNGAVGTLQLAEGSVTPDILADGAVTGNKIPPGSLPLSKLVIPASACLIGGTTTNGGSWYPLALGDWQIAAKKPQNNGPTAVSLLDVWNGTGGTFDGGKITAATLALSKLLSAQQSSMIAGTPTKNAYYEVPMGDWQIAVKRAQDNAPTAQTLDVIWANTANSFNGAQITNNSLSGNKILDNSIGSSKLNNAGQMIPFAMASVNANTSLNKSLNIGGVTKNGTGLYRVAFAAPASSANAIVIAVTNDGQGVNTVLSDQSTQAVVIRLMNLNGQNVDGGFDMIVYDF